MDNDYSLEETNSNEIVTALSDEARRNQEVIHSLLEPCDRITYGQRQREAAAKLGVSVRTVRRLVEKWEEQGNRVLTQTTRADKGKHRIDEDWQQFIIKTYIEGNKGSKRITPKQVAVRVQARAAELGQQKYPSYRTVYRVLQPIIERSEQTQSIRSRGWRGSRLSVKTRDGKDLSVEYSNHVWQCDHTLVDLLLVNSQEGEILGRPWLTTVIDSYSRCIMGIHLSYDAPSSQVVALALRHAILPKRYGPEYKLYCDWGTYGKPEHFYTDGGKDFRSNHLNEISVQLGFVCHLRDRPSEGGIVERPFGTFNTELFSTLPGYTGSNVQERSKEVEKEACLTWRELEQRLVCYIVNNYNQRLDNRTHENRFQRWESGLIATPSLLSERELDICLMKQTRRSIYRGGYLQFENLTYRGENLASYAGESVVLRYDPRDITTVLVYRKEGDREVFLARANATDLETEQLSLDEAKAISRKKRLCGETLSNRSILAEVRDRDTFVSKKKSRKERQKEETLSSMRSFTVQPPTGLTSHERESLREGSATLATRAAEEVETARNEPEPEMPEVFDYEQLREDYGW